MNLTLRCLHVSLGLLGVVVFCLIGQVNEGRARRTFIHERDVETAFVWESPPRWEGGKLVGCVHNLSGGPIIYTIDRDGRRDEIVFTLEGAARIDIFDMASSPEGEIALVGAAVTADTRGATFLARISANRERQTITRTWPYCPKVVTFAADGNLWTIGNLTNEEHTLSVAKNVLRRFDPSGKMLGSTTLRVKGWEPPDITLLRAARDRVGWFTREGEYLEFSLDGSEVARYEGPEGSGIESDNITGLVLTDNHEVIASEFGGGKAQFVVLNREQRVWTPVLIAKEQAPSWARVIGMDDGSLITTSANGRISRFKVK